jgi:LPS export ABC transporter protein LptC
MQQWQKRARVLVLVVAGGVAAAVFVTTRTREKAEPPKPIPREDPTAVVETSGAFLIQIKGARENFSIEAKKHLSYADGSSKLQGVKITSVRQGKTFVVTGDEAKVNADQSQIEVTGNVQLSATDGLEVTADSSTYNRGEGVVRAPGPITFKRGRLSGKGVDFSYDENRDLIGLSRETAIRIAPDNKGSDGADITAGSSLLARKEKFISLERAVHIVRPNQVIDADRGVADLTQDEQHLTGLELQGNARIAIPKAAAGELSAMSADVIDLTYAENSELIEKATLSNGASLRLAGEKGSPERELSAATIDLGLAADGATVTSLTARDNVDLKLPAPKGQASKGVRANSLVATGKSGAGLTSAVFTDNVEYRETGGTPPVQRVVTSRTLDTDLDGGLGAIREARFSGGVGFRDDSTQATAASMQYHVASGRVELRGNLKGAPPRVSNDEIVVDATTIDMDLDGPKLKATAGTEPVRTVMKPAKPGAKGTVMKTPRLMQQDQEVQGWSKELVYDGGKESKAEFTGAVRLQQKEMFIKADKVFLDGSTGNLIAEGTISSAFLVQDMNPDKKVRETTLANGFGKEMFYDEATRKVTYKSAARLDGPQGKLTARAIDLHLGMNGQDVERLEATGDVVLEEPDRITKGNHLNYRSEGQEYRMSGTKDKLVQMISRTDNDCQENTGNILTFSRATDSLRIDGQESSRTQSKDISCATAGLPPVKLDPGAAAPR